MKIFLAKDAGYCFGVRDAVNLAYDTAENRIWKKKIERSSSLAIMGMMKL